MRDFSPITAAGALLALYATSLLVPPVDAQQDHGGEEDVPEVPAVTPLRADDRTLLGPFESVLEVGTRVVLFSLTVEEEGVPPRICLTLQNLGPGAIEVGGGGSNGEDLEVPQNLTSTLCGRITDIRVRRGSTVVAGSGTRIRWRFDPFF